MRNIFTIARREIHSFFVSPIAYFVITGFFLLAGYFFFNLLGFFNIMQQRYRMMSSYGAGDAPNLNQWVVESFYQTLIVVLVFLIPFLTMRVIAEEKRRGTFELLVTSPLSVADIVIGKFLGVGFVILLMMGLIFMFPALLVIFGNPGPEIPPLFTGLLGISLCSLAFASLAMAVSCFTENQIVAGISGMVLLLLLYVIQSPAETIGGTTGDVLNYLSPITQVKDMLRGVLSISSIVYFLSLIGFGIFLSQRALEAYRWR
jgi:ABC-2 type transport system permease protein